MRAADFGVVPLVWRTLFASTVFAGCTQSATAPTSTGPTTSLALAPAASLLPALADQPVTDPVVRAWEQQLTAATPTLRERARALLDVCSVVESPAEEGFPASLECLPASFGAPRATHEFRLAREGDDGYPDLATEVRGSFLTPGADERLIMFAAGSNGSSGGTSGFLFTRHADDWALSRTFVSFPAVSCAALPRPNETALLLCGFSNRWQGQTSVWAALYDAGQTLEEDSFNAPEPTAEHGYLRPLQKVMTTDGDRVDLVHRCPPPNFMGSLELLADPPFHVQATPDGASLAIRVHDVSPKRARQTRCRVGDVPDPKWGTREVSYSLRLGGGRLVVGGSHVAQDAELRSLALVPPR